MLIPLFSNTFKYHGHIKGGAGCSPPLPQSPEIVVTNNRYSVCPLPLKQNPKYNSVNMLLLDTCNIILSPYMYYRQT